MAVYWEKTTDMLDLSDNEAMRQGRDLENYVAQRFTEETGKRCGVLIRCIGAGNASDYVCGCGSAACGGRCRSECKTVSAYNAGKWENGAIPMHYPMQCIHYMAVTGKRTWYIAAVILGQGFVYSRIDWDEEMGEQLIALEENFWENHILARRMRNRMALHHAALCWKNIFIGSKTETKGAVGSDGNKIKPQAGYFGGNETTGEKRRRLSRR